MKGFINDIWWMSLLRSLALILFGVAAVAWPGLTLVSLAVFSASLMLIAGIADVLMSIGAVASKRSWFIALILGIIEIVAGVYLFKNPTLILATFIGVVGFIFILQGILSIVASVVDTYDRGLKLLEIISGIIGIIAGFVILQHPITGGLAFTWVLGVYGIIAGTLSLATALSFRQFTNELENAISPKKLADKS